MELTVVKYTQRKNLLNDVCPFLSIFSSQMSNEVCPNPDGPYKITLNYQSVHQIEISTFRCAETPDKISK